MNSYDYQLYHFGYLKKFSTNFMKDTLINIHFFIIGLRYLLGFSRWFAIDRDGLGRKLALF